MKHPTFIPLLIAASSIPCLAVPPIPEPGAIFYGRVSYAGSETPLPISSFSWSVIEPGTGRTAQLSLGHGIQTVVYNSETWFVARFPFATNTAPGISFEPLPAGTFALSQSPISYDRSAAVVNGLAAVFRAPASTAFSLPSVTGALAEHSRVERIDLELSSSNQALYNNWISGYFPLSDPRSQPDADPDHDGLSNLMERALGLDPSRPSITPVASGTLKIGDQDYFTYTYRQPLDAADAPLTPEISEDMQTWQSGPTAIVEVRNVVDGTSRVITIRSASPMNISRKAFVRLKTTALRP